MKKSELRKLFLSKRKAISDDLFEKLCRTLFRNLLAHFDFSEKHVHLFLPISKQRELDTFALKEAIDEKFEKVKWVISKSHFENLSLSHFLWEKETELRENKWGIPEPVNAKAFPLSDIDIIFVPLLIADKKGNRVGYGKGFYDRFLAQVNAVKVGLSIFEPIEQIESEHFDIPLDFVASPQQVLKVISE